MCLLDIKIKEVSYENLMKGVKTYEKPRFLTAPNACRQMLEVEAEKKEGILTPGTLAIAVCRVGYPGQIIASGTLSELAQLDLGPALHTLVIPGEMHVLEKEMFDHFHYSKVLPDQKIKADAKPNSNNIIHKSNGIVSSASKSDKSESEMHVSLDAMDLIHILASKSDAAKLLSNELVDYAKKLITDKPGILSGLSKLNFETPEDPNVTRENGDGPEEDGVEDNEGALSFEERAWIERKKRREGRKVVKSVNVEKDQEDDEEEEEDDDSDDDDESVPEDGIKIGGFAKFLSK
eukprot:CAMPEP_0197537932 /NCGR_PEP_ID=MMETSP1318-20131121/58326_1 /TAXON_ID=552666 /ORGANISM="Partenskyella glossopodia, Strain RCC365" /LENGTH=291 /DNA_ID=CAMNT_0043096213 /DNA_START=93 /DNA_END=968 /DNA_ORIENTATION=-